MRDTNPITIEPPPAKKERAVMLGVFDGLHLGHQALLEEVFATAAKAALTPSVATFVPHPAAIVAPRRTPKLLQPAARRRAQLIDAGLAPSDVFAIGFTEALAAMTPEAFVAEVLVAALGAKAVIVGENFRFGQRRLGDVATLLQLGRALGFETHPVAPVCHPTLGIVSSTAIRRAICEHRLDDAQALWGQRARLYPLLAPASRPPQQLTSRWAELPRDPAGVWPKPGHLPGRVAERPVMLAWSATAVRWQACSAREAREEERLVAEQGLTLG